MKSSPWVKWFSADFLNGISDLEPNEIAVYSVVLNLIYDSEGPIIDDAVKIGRRCNMRQTSAEKALASLASAGKIIRIDGKITNHRCEKEIKSRQKVSEKSSEIANARWKKGAEKPSKINAAPMPTHAPSIATEMLSLSLMPETEKKEVASQPNARAAIASDFDEFWKLYPNKADKKVSAVTFAKVRKTNSQEAIMAGLRTYIATKPPDRQWLNPSTFLNRERWNDEPTPAQHRVPFAAHAGRSPGDEVAAAIMRKLDRQHSDRRETAGRDEPVTIIPPATGGHGRSAPGDYVRQAPGGRDEDTGVLAFGLPTARNLGWR